MRAMPISSSAGAKSSKPDGWEFQLLKSDIRSLFALDIFHYNRLQVSTVELNYDELLINLIYL
jgi:hypothetical protein